MIPVRRLPFLRVTAVLLAVCLTACRDEPAPAPPSAAGDPPVPVEGTSTPTAPRPATSSEAPDEADPDDIEARGRAAREDNDRLARHHLEVFRGVAYDPWRDAALRSAACTIKLDVEGRKGEYLVTFDGSQKDNEQATLEVVREDADIHPDAAKQAKRFALLGLRGAYSSVLSYTPPLQYQCYKAADEHTLVVIPPFKSAFGVTYRCDLRGLVESMGATDGKVRVRTVFHWDELPGGKFLLRRAVEEGGKVTTDYVHTDFEGVPLVTHAALVEGIHSCVADLTWTDIVLE